MLTLGRNKRAYSDTDIASSYPTIVLIVKNRSNEQVK